MHRLYALILWLLVGVAHAAPIMVVMPSGGGGLILDGVSGVKGAYSFGRKLRTAYAGSAFRVRRLSDSTEQDIGFSGNVVDTSALSSFCAGTNCLVDTVYDQSSSAANFTNGTDGPRIVNSGTTDVINTTRPAAVFSGVATSSLTATTNPVLGNTNTIYFFAVVETTGANKVTIVNTIVGTGIRFYVSDTNHVGMDKEGVVNIGESSGTISDGTAAVTFASYDGSTATFRINGSASGTGSSSQTFSPGDPAFGGESEYFEGKIGELIIVDSASFTSTAAFEADMKTAWGTP